MTEVSLVLPAYNEAERLKGFMDPGSYQKTFFPITEMLGNRLI